MSYRKTTMFITTDRKFIHRNGHTKKVSSVPPTTLYINYYVYDMSGHGRNGMSTVNFTKSTTDTDLVNAARKA